MKSFKKFKKEITKLPKKHRSDNLQGDAEQLLSWPSSFRESLDLQKNSVFEYIKRETLNSNAE